VGLEPVFWLSWIAQIAAALVIAFRRAQVHRWFSAAGILFGTAAAFAPVYLWRDLFWPAAMSAFFASIIVLLVAYTVGRRWKTLAILLLLLVAPLAYALAGRHALPPESSPAFLGFFQAVGEMNLLLGPIVCGLAAGEILGILDRLLASQRKLA
jgi:hypothetical protein